MERKRVCVTLSEPYLKGIQELLDGGVYYNRTELLRNAVRMLLQKHGIQLVEPE